MKNAPLSLIIGLTLLSSASLADTGEGCALRAIPAANGQPAMVSVEAKGRIVLWLKDAESGSYKNEGTVDENGNIHDSEATKACATKRDDQGAPLGLSLATQEDYETLLSCFEMSTRYENAFSDAGNKEFTNLFPKEHDHVFFWTSTHAGAKGSRDEGYLIFLSPPAFSISKWPVSFNNSVRCVRH
jgi:hypothetical protein